MRTDRARAVPAASDLPPGTWPWLHEVARWIGRWWFRPFFRVRWHRRESIPACGPVVLVSNHSTLVEGPLLFGMLVYQILQLFLREEPIEATKRQAGW